MVQLSLKKFMFRNAFYFSFFIFFFCIPTTMFQENKNTYISSFNLPNKTVKSCYPHFPVGEARDQTG